MRWPTPKWPGRFALKMLAQMLLVALLSALLSTYAFYYVVHRFADFSIEQSERSATASKRAAEVFRSYFADRKEEFRRRAQIIAAGPVTDMASLAVTEGLRYDGFVQLHPEQPVHLKSSAGAQRTLPLAALTPADVAVTQEALVMDNEAFGFRFDHRRALDRKGFAFKVDFGSLDSLCGCYSAAGLASNIQVGYFPHHRFGLLGTLTLGGGTNALDQTFQRHSANLEAQFFPLQAWRIHLGGFGHGGMQVARDEFGTRTGPAWGGGAILEFALTTRLALTGRMDYTIAHTAPDEHAVDDVVKGAAHHAGHGGNREFPQQRRDGFRLQTTKFPHFKKLSRIRGGIGTAIPFRQA